MSVPPESAMADRDRPPFGEREALLGWLEEIAPYGIFTTDAELRIRSWNRWLATHSGMTADAVVGRLLVEVFPSVRERKLEGAFHRALSGEVSVLSTALHRYLLPFPATVRAVKTPFMLQTVRIAPLPARDLGAGAITIIEDVTQRETQAIRLQRQQEHERLLSLALSTLLQSHDPLRDIAALLPQITLPLGLELFFNYLLDPATQHLHLNAAGGISPRQREQLSTIALGEGLCGTCAESRQPIRISQSTTTGDDRCGRLLRDYAIQSYCAFPLVIEDRVLGTLSFGSYTRDAIPDDEVECLSTIAKYVAVAMDRAQREDALRAAQATLREHAVDLEGKVNQRTLELQDTIAQLETFSYTVAHDLRAPIRSLKGYCEILLSDFPLPPAGQDLLRRLNNASLRLDRLTRDLLTFSRISGQLVPRERVDIRETIEDIVQATEALQGGVLSVQGPLGEVWVERTLFGQCLTNVFDNALKFTAPGERPHIEVWSECRTDARGADTGTGVVFNPATHGTGSASPHGIPATSAPHSARLRIWIADRGIGIAPEAHEKIFGIFERVSGLEQVEGTGIGLAIVARAAERMGGTCGVESQLGHGSRFWLEFPAGDEPAPLRASDRAAPG